MVADAPKVSATKGDSTSTFEMTSNDRKFLKLSSTGSKSGGGSIDKTSASAGAAVGESSGYSADKSHNGSTDKPGSSKSGSTGGNTSRGGSGRGGIGKGDSSKGGSSPTKGSFSGGGGGSSSGKRSSTDNKSGSNDNSEKPACDGADTGHMTSAACAGAGNTCTAIATAPAGDKPCSNNGGAANTSKTLSPTKKTSTFAPTSTAPRKKASIAGSSKVSKSTTCTTSPSAAKKATAGRRSANPVESIYKGYRVVNCTIVTRGPAFGLDVLSAKRENGRGKRVRRAPARLMNGDQRVVLGGVVRRS